MNTNFSAKTTEAQKADLHVHSYFSDGTNSPEEIVISSHALGNIGISITDHDTIAGLEEAKQAAKKVGIGFVTGVELSSQYRGESLHILGYGFDSKKAAIQLMCEEAQIRRLHRFKKMLERISKNICRVEFCEIEELFPHAVSFGRAHIASFLVQKKLVCSFKEAFLKFLGKGKCCYVEGEKWSVEKILDHIHQASGYAVLAHPHLLSSIEFCKTVLEFPFDGIECYYAQSSSQKNDVFVSLAKSRGLLITGGSDFHGSIKPDVPLLRAWAPYESFLRLMKSSS